MPKPANKPIIAIDIDDVLAANAAGFVKFSNERWGTNLEPDDYDEHWAEMWHIDAEETEKRRLEIIEAKVFTSYHFFNEAKPVLQKLKNRFSLAVVTSRGPKVQADTTAWLKKEYGNLFDKIQFSEIWESQKDISEKLKFTKAETLIKLGASYLVDDQPKHCIAAAQAGITAVMFGDYRWSQEVKLLPNMVRARDWQAVLEYFEHETGQ